MSYKKPEKEPVKAYVVQWGRVALERLRHFKDEGQEIKVLNPSAFEDLALKLETQKKRTPQVSLAPHLRAFNTKILSLIEELEKSSDSTLIEEEVQRTMVLMESTDPEDEVAVRKAIAEDEVKLRSEKISSVIKELLATLITLSTQWEKAEAFRIVRKDEEESQ